MFETPFLFGLVLWNMPLTQSYILYTFQSSARHVRSIFRLRLSFPWNLKSSLEGGWILPPFMSTAKKPELSAVNKGKNLSRVRLAHCINQLYWNCYVSFLSGLYFVSYYITHALHVQINHSGNTSFPVTLYVLCLMHPWVIVRSCRIKSRKKLSRRDSQR